MRISFITLHRVRNYGSSLQTYATQEFFKERGLDVILIDYYPERYTSIGLLSRLKNKSEKLKNNFFLLFCAKIIMSISYVKKKIIFDRFLKKYIRMTKKTFRKESDFKNYNFDCDLFFTGSDQVWNSYWNEGVDRPMFLDFVPNKHFMFSFASSIGEINFQNHEVVEIKDLLSRYNFLSVREDSGVELLNLLGFNAKQLIDPTLYFDIKFWNRITSDKYKNRKYIVTYNLHHDKKIDDFAETIKKRYKCQIYNISYNIHDIFRKGKLIWCPKIEEYLGLIRDAQLVTTDSFHATVFSNIFHTNFFVFYPEKASSRLKSLLTMLKILDRGGYSIPEPKIFEDTIRFTEIDEILAKERIKTNLFVDDVLKEYNESTLKERNYE